MKVDNSINGSSNTNHLILDLLVHESTANDIEVSGPHNCLSTSLLNKRLQLDWRTNLYPLMKPYMSVMTNLWSLKHFYPLCVSVMLFSLAK